MEMDFKTEQLMMKAAGVAWLRYDKRCFAVATEAGEFNSDIMGMNSKRLVEIEVKRDKADFTADFHKRKHRYYKQYPQKGPHQMYFMVPERMADWAERKLAKLEPDYGLLIHVCRKNEYQGKLSPHKWVNYIDGTRIRAKTLHAWGTPAQLETQLLMRMGSELARFWAVKVQDLT